MAGLSIVGRDRFGVFPLRGPATGTNSTHHPVLEMVEGSQCRVFSLRIESVIMKNGLTHIFISLRTRQVPFRLTVPPVLLSSLVSLKD